MIKRTMVLLLAGVLVGGCGDGGTEPATTESDVLFLRTSSGVAIVEADTETEIYNSTGAVPSSDWSTVVETTFVQKQKNAHTTRVEAVEPESGRVLWERTVPGRMKVKVVSSDGNLVALAPEDERHHLSGRRTTELLIVDGRTDQTRTVEVSENLEPEAFATDGESLFVLVYTPSTAPRNYQVRRLDLATEELMEVYTPDAHLQERMRGTARIQAMSPDGSRLYTLYTTGFGKNAHSFIHTLDLDELWAHCITLPHEFSRANESTTGIAVSADGDRLFVADTIGDAVAEIDTQRLEVTRTESLDLGNGWPTTVMSPPSGGLYVASGARLTSVSFDGLTPSEMWTLRQRITGLQYGEDGKKLYVGLRRSVDVFDTTTGAEISSLNPPGVTRIELMGRGSRTLTDYQTLKCAC
jgi:WD40 repeat protein